MSTPEARYFPILRGRQNELIAIRELANAGKLARVVPIIEPVKASSTLIKTLVESFSSGATIGIVLNPQVGSFDRDVQNNPDFGQRYRQLLLKHETRTQLFLRVSKEDVHALEFGFSKLGGTPVNTDNWNAIMARDTTRSAVIAVQTLKKQGAINRIVSTFPKPLNHFRRDRVILIGGIEIPARNADYRKRDDEFFSDGASSYSMYGCEGFSDYSIVGEPYKSGGFSPRAVALHLTYFDEDGDVRIKHFVSNPPDDTGDVPGKYADAVKALCAWADVQDSSTLPRTIGLEYFFQTFEDQRFPGLGAVKKYSIMHHLEMIDSYLGGVE